MNDQDDKPKLVIDTSTPQGAVMTTQPIDMNRVNEMIAQNEQESQPALNVGSLDEDSNAAVTVSLKPVRMMEVTLSVGDDSDMIQLITRSDVDVLLQGAHKLIEAHGSLAEYSLEIGDETLELTYEASLPEGQRFIVGYR